jgi:hypothetical protein
VIIDDISAAVAATMPVEPSQPFRGTDRVFGRYCGRTVNASAAVATIKLLKVTSCNFNPNFGFERQADFPPEGLNRLARSMHLVCERQLVGTSMAFHPLPFRVSI